MTLSPLLYLLIILLGLLGFNAFIRKYTVILFFFIVPVILTPFWINGVPHLLFTWAKLYSIIAANVLFFFFRYTKFGDKKYAKIFIYVILAINILEASLQDFSPMQVPGILNALAGLLLIFSIPSWRSVKVEKNSSDKNMVWPEMTALWIAAYVIWNWTFVYLSFPEHAAYHFVILLSCVIPALFRKEIWLQARAFTLGIWMIYFFTFYDTIMKNALILPRNDLSMLVFACLSLLVGCANFFIFIRGSSNSRAYRRGI